MTAITPLQSVHKKGLFGNHYKKEESDLLNITEVTDLTIVQIAQYKNSKINLNNLNIDGLKFPLQPSTVSSNQGTRILWSGPNTWLVVSKKKIL